MHTTRTHRPDTTNRTEQLPCGGEEIRLRPRNVTRNANGRVCVYIYLQRIHFQSGTVKTVGHLYLSRACALRYHADERSTPTQPITAHKPPTRHSAWSPSYAHNQDTTQL